jgi:hypothetical protein
MLLLVVEADLQDAQHLRKLGLVHRRYQSLDGGVDMGAKIGNLGAVRPREEPALRSRVARAGGDVIGIEQIGELRVERPVAGKLRDQQELLEEPGGMRPVPLGGARIGHRLHHLVFGTKRRRTPLGLRAHGAKGRAPDRPRIVRRRRDVVDCCGVAVVAKATNDGRGGRGRHAQSQAGGLRNSQDETELACRWFPNYIRNRPPPRLRRAHI